MNFFRLDKPVQFLKGVGPVRAEALGRMGIVTARDLLYHVPRRYDDASTIEPMEGNYRSVRTSRRLGGCAPRV